MWREALQGAPSSELESLFTRGTVPAPVRVPVREGAPSGKSWLYAAAEQGNPEGVSRLLMDSATGMGMVAGDRSNLGRTPAHAAVIGGHEDVLRVLLSQGVVVSEADPPSRATPYAGTRGLMMGPVDTGTPAPASGSLDASKQASLYAGMTAGRVDAWDTEALLAAAEGPDPSGGAYLDPNAEDHTGHTALSLAAKNGAFYICSILVQADGVDVNTRNRDGMTALMFAARHGHLRVVRLLSVQRGIDVDVKDKFGMTAFMMAQKGAKGSGKADGGKTHAEIARLLWKASAFKYAPGQQAQGPAEAKPGPAGPPEQVPASAPGAWEPAPATAATEAAADAPKAQMVAFGKVITCGACGGKGHNRRSKLCPLKA